MGVNMMRCRSPERSAGSFDNLQCRLNPSGNIFHEECTTSGSNMKHSICRHGSWQRREPDLGSSRPCQERSMHGSNCQSPGLGSQLVLPMM